MAPNSAHLRAAPLYAGGILGPYAGTMVTPMVVEVGADLDATPGAVAGSLTAYMVPFAVLMLVSGTLAERWGREATMRWSLVAFALAGVGCAFVPNLAWLYAAQAAMGCANAFTTPLLLAAITDLVPRERLGRALGLFAGVQALGQAASPLVSGLAATVDWRLAFAAPTLIALALALTVPPMGAPSSDREGARSGWRALLTAQLALACAVAFLCYLAGVAVTVLAVLRAEDDFGLGPGARGLIVTGFGIAGLVAGPLLGRRAGSPRTLALALVPVLVGGLVLSGLGASVALLTLGIALSGAAVTGLRAVVNGLATTSAPGNRAGAASVGLSLQFAGGALAPVIAVPLYGAIGGAALAVVALAPLLAGVLLVLSRCTATGAPAPSRP